MEMDHRNLENIVEIYQDNKVEEVNRYLALGWTLLNVHTTDYGHPVERHQSTEFTVGWNKDKGGVQKPEKIKGQWDEYIDLVTKKANEN